MIYQKDRRFWIVSKTTKKIIAKENENEIRTIQQYTNKIYATANRVSLRLFDVNRRVGNTCILLFMLGSIMKKRKRTKPTKWRTVCKDCYRKQYCQFVLTTDSCILFRPSDAKRAEDYHNEYIITNQ